MKKNLKKILMKHILGLDLGTNSIGWALLNAAIAEDGKESLQGIIADGSRIIPVDAKTLGDFDNGQSISQTAKRTKYRGMRRLRERELLRRERLHRVLRILNFLPEHYAASFDDKGKFIQPEGCKLAWTKDETGNMRFLFQSSFEEMLRDFQEHHPQLLANGKKIPYDWTLYYLRKKALTQRIEKEELAWILLNFNQKRGYYQRGEENSEENAKKSSKTRTYFLRERVISVQDSGKFENKSHVFYIKLENGEIGKVLRETIPQWEGHIVDLLVSINIDKDGNIFNDEDGIPCRTFKEPTEDDRVQNVTIIRQRVEEILDQQNKTVGSYIYDSLLCDPDCKIKGKQVGVVDRKYYKNELLQILKTQIQYHPQLQDAQLYNQCVLELYGSNNEYRNSISTRDIVYLLVDNILFYQRCLKSKRSTIADCPYEVLCYKKEGAMVREPLKAIAKSSPLFQEFRLWQFISNLRIYKKEGKDKITGQYLLDQDITDSLLSTDTRTELFDWLNDKKKINQEELLKHVLHLKKEGETSAYRWNYVEDKDYPCNETRAQFISLLKKGKVGIDFLTREREEALWQMLYTTTDPIEREKALGTFAQKNNLPESFVEAFRKFSTFKREYGSYSTKAIKKLLPLMRMGHHWDEAAIDVSVRERIEKLINGEVDANIDAKVYERVNHLTDISQFSGLPTWLACYVVYGRHSEAKDIQKWTKPEDIDNYLLHFKQHSLRNPIVEQVVTETLRTVKDIWKRYGSIDEIHIELGREMKNPAKVREKMAKQAAKNENTNLRIKALLWELANDDYGIQDVRPYSPYQQEILRIYEEEVLQNTDKVTDEIRQIQSKLQQANIENRPTKEEVEKYKLWLEQKYRSPYTGEVISLSKLFTSAYQIEHIIPKARYFDDSLSNKVICESEVNQLKGNRLGYEFIQGEPGRIVGLSGGHKVKIFTGTEYEQFVNEHYSHNRVKKNKLLMNEIPDDFIQRQLNDSRYISNLVKGLLSNIVREENEPEAISKHVITCNGSITDRLKKDWGINDIWNHLILPRFERMNKMDDSKRFTSVNSQDKIIPSMPLELQKGFNKKRIDHRHHAMDAIVIACANRNIVNYLNNASACKDAKLTRHDLQSLLCDKQKNDNQGNYQWVIKKPWDTFTQDVRVALEKTLASFKQNLRVINKTQNRYQHIDKEGKKEITLQVKGENWSIRKKLHEETYYGEVNLRTIKTVKLADVISCPSRIVNKDLKRKLMAMLTLGYDVKQISQYFKDHKEEWTDINLKSIEVYSFSKETGNRYFATRKALNPKMKIEQITDTGIRKILKHHLAECNGDSKVAFSPEGIERMNQNITRLNDGCYHKPIYKARFAEQAGRFAVGQTGNKKEKFVQTGQGTNLFLAIYETSEMDPSTGEKVIQRKCQPISFNVVMERYKNGLSAAPEDEFGNPPKYMLSPNDLVYLPTSEEVKAGKIKLPVDTSRIYKLVSMSGTDILFLPSNVASPIVNKVEFEKNNKIGRAITGEMIKETCIPITIDRLGNIKLPE